MFRTSYKLLLAATVVLALSGLITLLPAGSASYPNVLGYSSFCTFTPASTLFCFLAAGICCFIRSSFIKDQSGTPGQRFRRHSRSLLVLGLVLVLALGSTGWFVSIQSRYTDSATGASFSE